MPPDSDNDKLPTRHDAIQVQRVKELTELAAGTTKEQTISKS